MKFATPTALFAKHRDFWGACPALLCGISLLIGIGVFLFECSIWLMIFWSIYLLLLRRWASLFLLFFGGAYAAMLYANLPAETPIECSARFSIASLQRHQTPFHQNLLYRGTLYLNGSAFPCAIATKPGPDRPNASTDYWLEGTLIERERFDYLFKPKQWTPIAGSWSLAEIRFLAKEKIRSFLQGKLDRPRTAIFLSSLATGEVEDRQLRYEFGRLGLQHLLAISGFHFGVLLTFISLLLGLFLPQKLKWASMLLCTSFYFLFIGASPAVQRAWLGATLFLIGKLLRRKAEPLNLLGAAMLIELIAHPLAAANPGFQLSFGSCFGILLLYRFFEEQLRALFPARPLEQAASLSVFSQCAYLLSSAFRRSISISLSVNAAILPLLLYHFGRFPYLSLLYNLFVPFLVSLSLFGLFAALLAHLALGSWSSPLFSLLDWLSAQILDLTQYPPLCLDYSLYASEFPSLLLPAYLFLLFSLKLFCEDRLGSPENKRFYGQVP